MILQLTSVQCVKLQDRSFDWLVGLVFLMGWIEDEAPLHSFPTNFELKSDRMFSGMFCYHCFIERIKGRSYFLKSVIILVSLILLIHVVA
jgi:hypothetical protein